MGTLKNYANSTAVETALDKGIQGYDKAVKNETDILSVRGDIDEELSEITEQTRNLIVDRICNARVNSSGKIEVYEGYDVCIAPVEANEEYIKDGTTINCGFFSECPKIGDTTYNGERIMLSVPNITSPISGYIAVLYSVDNAEPQFEKGTIQTRYIAPIVAKDGVAREKINELSETVSNVNESCDKLNDTISDIKKGYYKTSKTYTPVLFSLKDGYGYWAINREPVVFADQTASWYGSEPIEVVGGNAYRIITRTRDNVYNRGWIVVDENYNIVQMAEAVESSTTITEEVTIEATGKYLLVNQYNTTTATVDLVSEEIIPVISEKKYSGKKWVVVGDSLTEGTNTTTTKRYYDYVSDDNGITVVNFGENGSGYKRKEDTSKAFYQRVANIPTDADVVTIFGSGNDMRYVSAELGTKDDVFDASAESNTLGACINRTIDVLQSVIPTVRLGIVSPCPWASYNPFNADTLMGAYTTLLKEICEKRSIPFLDLYHCSNLRPWDSDFRTLVYDKDTGALDGNPQGTHPNEIGHQMLSGRFKIFIESIL